MHTTREAPDVTEFLSERAGRHPDAVVLACNPYEPASLAAIRRLADALRTTYLVVVSSDPDGAGLRQALNAGADGVVFESDLESTLGPVTQSVLVGHISLPRRFHRCVVKPVFSHREKEVLAMVVKGLGNRQIANRLFLAESTVKSHLSTAFQKLGVRSRKEAAALLMDPEEGLEAVLSIEGEQRLNGEAGALSRWSDPARTASLRIAVAPEPAPPTVASRPRSERGGMLAHGRTWFLIGADALAITAALVVTYGVADMLAPPAIIAPSWLTVTLALLALPFWIAVFTVYNLYERQHRSISLATFDEIGELFHALLAGSLVFLIASQVLRRVMGAEVYFPVEAAMFLATALPLVLLARGTVRSFVFPAVMNPRRTLIVGAGEVGQVVERKIRSHPEYGLELVGFVDEGRPGGGDAPILGRPGELPRLVDTLEIDWVILAFSQSSYEDTLDLLRAARRPDVHLSIVPRFFEVFASNATIQELEGMPVVNLPLMRLSRSVRFLKRAVDLLVASAGLLVLSPLLAVVALAIKLDSRGAVFFRQERHGRGGSVFRILKFRTMEDGAEAKRQQLAQSNQVDGALFKIKEDPRVTRVGRLLRRTSIDELPQLWNVLKGEMSLVGPRPFVIHESSQITGWASRRLDLTPGITGLWQVLGRNDLPFDEMVKLDYIYVTNWSLWWDLKILCQTIPVVLARRGAY